MKISFGITSDNMVFLQFTEHSQRTTMRTDIILPPDEGAQMAVEIAKTAKEAAERALAKAAISRQPV